MNYEIYTYNKLFKRGKLLLSTNDELFAIEMVEDLKQTCGNDYILFYYKLSPRWSLQNEAA